jgi:hypothetical protein
MSNEILQLQSRELMQMVVTTLDADIDYLEKDRLRYVELYRNAPVRMFVVRKEGDFECQLKLVPCGEMQVSVEGPGRILGCGNGDPAFRAMERPEDPDGKRFTIETFNGLAQVLIQSTGEPGDIRITLKSEPCTCWVTISAARP